MRSARRLVLFAAGVAVIFLLGSAAGFNLGRRWPLARLERLRTKLFREPPLGWTIAARSDLPRYELLRVVHGTSLYLFSGFYTDDPRATARVEVLDLVTGKWLRKHDIPQSLTHTPPVLLRDTVWFVGGFEGDHPGPATTRVWRYDLASDRWSNGPALPAARGGGALVAMGDTLHFFGGWLPDRNSGSQDHWLLAPGESGWRRAEAMPVPRGHLSAALLGSGIYAFGGTIGHDTVPIDVAIAHRFDPVSGRWGPAPSLPFALSHAEPSTTVYDGRLLIVGGRGLSSGRANLDDILLFDDGLGRWFHLGRTPKPILGGIGVTVGDTLYAGLGATQGADPDNLLIWRTTLRNRWHRGDSMPLSLGEVAGGVIDGRLYLVGQGSRHSLVYQVATGRWGAVDDVAARPADGDHHAAEVVGGRLYLLGGFGRNSEGRVQIYDPVTNQWSLGSTMPFAAGSSASAVIGGKIYVAGGITGRTTTNQAAVLDPTTMQWTPIAPMPRPRNHAASATDGSRLFVFGGRGPGSGDSNVVANGFDDTQVYDPVTNTWLVSDGSPGAPIPLPQGRGGTGKAVWLDGEFWVIGGETGNDAGAGKLRTYSRVDIYDPIRNRWRVGSPLPTARHGIFPVVDGGMIYVAGGGTRAGESESNLLEMIWPRRLSDR